MSEKLQIKQIKTNGGTQARASLDEATVAEYRQIVEESQQANEGVVWPFTDPVVLFYDGADHWLADGFHRVESCLRAGRYVVEADIRQGTRRDAILFAAGANADHGLRRTDSDKRRAVQRLLEDEEWGKWSDREIARACKVSHPFVARLRSFMPPAVTGNVTSEPPTERTYTTKHGTTAVMNTANIGKSRPKIPKIGPSRVEVDVDFIEMVKRTYSGDSLMKNRIMKPFKYNGELYVHSGGTHGPGSKMELRAVRVVEPDEFDGDAITYADVCDRANNGWRDAGLFYYGMKVKCNTHEYIMAYPEITFVYNGEETAVSDDFAVPDSPFYVGPKAQGPEVREALSRYLDQWPDNRDFMIRCLANRESSRHGEMMKEAAAALGSSDMFIWHQAMIWPYLPAAPRPLTWPPIGSKTTLTRCITADG